MTFKKRFTTAIATGAVLVNALAPVAFAETITVSGNGSLSNNAVNVNTNSTTVVNQTNNANIVNNVSSNASTGGNSSNYNTGGDSVIRTGNATTTANVSTAANLNKASVADCGACNGGSTTVNVSGNGAYSDNGVNVNKTNSVFLDQDNNANIANYVNAQANTGKNKSSYNTGGDSVVITGNATTNVSVANKANANLATIGGGAGSMGGSSVTISGNGALSDNSVNLNRDSAVVLDQYNSANVKNKVDADAKTGDNDAKFNTGGTVGIVTGDAKTNVAVDNMVNFNAAEVDCDCVLGDLEVKIAGNGADSLNEVEAVSDNALFNDQDNLAKLYNDVEGDAKTGYNDVAFSTSDPDGDPLIHTGNGESSTTVSNAGNVNVFDNGNGLHLPGDWDLDFDWDLHGLWLSLNHWMVA